MVWVRAGVFVPTGLVFAQFLGCLQVGKAAGDKGAGGMQHAGLPASTAAQPLLRVRVRVCVCVCVRVCGQGCRWAQLNDHWAV